jgi:hypothetical protein
MSIIKLTNGKTIEGKIYIETSEYIKVEYTIPDKHPLDILETIYRKNIEFILDN